MVLECIIKLILWVELCTEWLCLEASIYSTSIYSTSLVPRLSCGHSPMHYSLGMRLIQYMHVHASVTKQRSVAVSVQELQETVLFTYF